MSTACHPAKNRNELLQTVAKEDSARMGDMMKSLIDDMSNLRLTKDPDIDFATIMKLHHECVMQMADMEIRMGKDTAIQTRAKNLLNRLQIRNKILDGFVFDQRPDNLNDSFSLQAISIFKQLSYSKNIGDTTSIIDQQFLSIVPVEHEIAIRVATVYLHYGTVPELKTVASSIISSKR